MTRALDDWIGTYVEFFKETESPPIYHTWVALSVLSGAAQKKLMVQTGRLRDALNLYIILVGPPGIRKTTAVNYGFKFLSSLENISISADVSSPEAFIQDLEISQLEAFIPGEGYVMHSSLTAVSRELAVLLGEKATNGRMLKWITDLYDAPEYDWKYRLKTAASSTLPNPFLSIIGATTPASLGGILPAAAVGEGLSSRFMFIYSEEIHKAIPVPIPPEDESAIEAALLHDIQEIHELSGLMRMNKEAIDFWSAWYVEDRAKTTERICLDPDFGGWYERKGDYLRKLAALCSLSRCSSRVITCPDIERALLFLEEMEQDMGHAFAGVGKSTIVSQQSEVTKILRQRKIIKETELMSIVIKNLDADTFKKVMATLTKAGKVKFSREEGSGYWRWLG